MKRVLLALAFAFASGAALAQPSGLLLPGSVLGNPLTTTAPARSMFTSSFGTVNPMNAPYNAKCDGVTDDSTAFQSALNAVGTNGIRTVLIPATQNGCAVHGLNYNTSSGPILIHGEGPGSKLVANSAVGVLTITGSCGLTEDNAFLKNFHISNGTLAASAFGIKMNGTAGYGIDDVNVWAGANPFTKGIWLSGAQQGYVHAGLNGNNTDGIYLDDCTFSGIGNISSNGIELSNGQFFDTNSALNNQGGAGDVWFHDNHVVSSTFGVIQNQTGGAGGSGPMSIDNDHIEGTITAGILVQAGYAKILHLNDYNGTHTSVHVLTGASAIIRDSLINGNIIFDAGAANGLVVGNSLNGTWTNNAGSVVNAYSNIGNGVPISDITNFNQKFNIATTAVTSGDILSLRPNAGIGGPWGMSIRGAGGGTSGDIYVDLGSGTITGNTGGGGVFFKATPGAATDFGRFNSTGLFLPATAVIAPEADSANAIRFSNAGTGSTIMQLDSTNLQVGIGKAPGTKLDVNGNVSATQLTLPVGGVISQSGTSTALYTDATNTLLNVPTTGTISFRVNNGNVMTLGNPTNVVALQGNVASTSSTTGTETITGGLGVSSAIYAGAEVVTGVTVVGSLPTCNAAHQGARMFVTDQNTALAYHGAVTGGGTGKQGVTCDGTAWYQN